MNAVKIILLDLMFMIVFPATSSAGLAPEVLQLMFLHAQSFVAIGISNLLTSATVRHILMESQVLVLNCAYFLDKMIKTMRLPKRITETTKRKKLSTSIDELAYAIDAPTIKPALHVEPDLEASDKSTATAIVHEDPPHVAYPVRGELTC